MYLSGQGIKDGSINQVESCWSHKFLLPSVRYFADQDVNYKRFRIEIFDYLRADIGTDRASPNKVHAKFRFSLQQICITVRIHKFDPYKSSYTREDKHYGQTP